MVLDPPEPAADDAMPRSAARAAPTMAAMPDLDSRFQALWELAALARALTGHPDSALTQRSSELIHASHLDVDGLSESQRGLLRAELDAHFAQARTLAAGDSTPGWDPDEATLQAQGRASRQVATLIADRVVPRFPRLATQIDQPGARFLDVGVGVGQISLGLCERFSELRCTGIDINPRPLQLAAQHLSEEARQDRIELRQLDVAELADHDLYTLAWVPAPFLPQNTLVPGLAAIYRALAPGGWVIVGCSPPDTDAIDAATNRLRATILGGNRATAETIADHLGHVGYTDIRRLPSETGGPPGLVLARKPEFPG